MRAFRKAMDLGLNFFDTAEVYAGGLSERLLGEFSRGYGEDEVVIATKVWPTHAWANGVVKSAMRSLERLSRSHIDLYQLHWPNPFIPLGSTCKGFRALLEEGVVRAVGVSNFSVGRALKFKELMGGRLDSNQVRYSLLSWRRVEEELLPTASRHNITILGYSPLDQGVVTGRYTPENLPRDLVRRANPVFTPSGVKKLRGLVETLKEVSLRRGVGVAEVVVSFIISRGVVPIVGVKRPEHVVSLRNALELQLSSNEVDMILRARDSVRGLGVLAYLEVLPRLLGLI